MISFFPRSLFDSLRRRLGARTNTSVTRKKPNRTMLRINILEDRLAPATLTQSFSYGPSATNWTANLGSFSRFDPSLGTLNLVTVTESASASQSANFGKLTALDENVGVDATLPNSQSLNTNVELSGSGSSWTLNGSDIVQSSYSGSS